MGVESGGDQDQIRPEIPQPRQYPVGERLLECVSGRAGEQRRVDDRVMFASLAASARARIERRLMGRAEQHRLVRPENLLRAIAVMHVEIDDGDSLDAVGRLGVTGGDGDIIDEAEAHGIARAGVMARRARGHESVVGPPRHHLVDGGDAAAGRAPDGLDRLGTHERVAVERGVAFARRRLFERREIGLRMNALQRLWVGPGRAQTRQRGETLVFQPALDRPQAFGPLGVAGAHLMLQSARMCDEKGSQRYAAIRAGGAAPADSVDIPPLFRTCPRKTGE